MWFACRMASLLWCSLGLSGAPLWVPWAFLGFLGADVVEIYVICALSGQILSIIIVGNEFLDVKVSVFIENWSDVDSKTSILLQTWCVTQVMPKTFPRVLSFEFVRTFRLAAEWVRFLNSWIQKHAYLQWLLLLGTDFVGIYVTSAPSGPLLSNKC